MGLCGARGEGFGDGDPCGSGREGLGQGEDTAGSGAWGPGVLVVAESGRGMLEVLGVTGMEPASLPALLEGDSSPCPSAKPLPGPEGLLFITNRGQWAGVISGVPMREPCSPCCTGTQRALRPGDCHCSPRPDAGCRPAWAAAVVASQVSSPSEFGCGRSGRSSPESLWGEGTREGEHGGELGSFLTSWASKAARGPCRLNSACPVPVMHGELCPCCSPREGRGGDGEWCRDRSLLCLLAA